MRLKWSDVRVDLPADDGLRDISVGSSTANDGQNVAVHGHFFAVGEIRVCDLERGGADGNTTNDIVQVDASST